VLLKHNKLFYKIQRLQSRTKLFRALYSNPWLNRTIEKAIHVIKPLQRHRLRQWGRALDLRCVWSTNARL